MTVMYSQAKSRPNPRDSGGNGLWIGIAVTDWNMMQRGILLHEMYIADT